MVYDRATKKLAARFINEPKKITPAKCKRLLEGLGYTLRKSPGSENVYHKKGLPPVNVPTPKKSKYVDSVYIKRLVKTLDLEDILEGK